MVKKNYADIINLSIETWSLSVIALLIMTLLLIGSVTTNCSIFHISLIRYQATYKLTKLYIAPVSMSADRSNLFMEICI